MAVKILIYRKIKPGKEKELSEARERASVQGDPRTRLYFRGGLVLHGRSFSPPGDQYLEKHWRLD